MWDEFIRLAEIAVALISSFYLVGIALSLHAVMRARTSQGAIAWALSLITLPYITIPLYLIFGRGKFYGYIIARRKHRNEILPLVERLQHAAPVQRRAERSGLLALESLAMLPATSGNSLQLLVDGQESYPEMLRLIEQAEEYVLVQFYIVRDDNIGNRFADALAAKAKAGVRVYFLYDEIGSYSLSSAYIEKLTASGVRMHRFHTTKGRSNRFQINFRNHRKIVLIDGTEAVMGGLNLGDEYNGENPQFGPWRDTNVKIVGPAVSCLQLSFLEDWHWAQSQIPELNWDPKAQPDGDEVLIFPTGPVDELENCSLFFSHAIYSAKKRLWIASPYFVPDSSVIAALQLAALRGVDVRIMIPANPDNKLVYLASFFYTDLVQKAGVKVYRYQKGFMHHKVMLVDDNSAAVGSANLDNRSFRLNFEITMAAFGSSFASKVQAMLENDFKQCVRVEEPLDQRRLGFRILVKLARLCSPVL